MTELKNWSIISEDWDGYKAPEQRAQYLKGNVFNHPSSRFPDGKEITTSAINYIDRKNKIVECYSRHYFLSGPPDPKWIEWLTENNLLHTVKDLV